MGETSEKPSPSISETEIDMQKIQMKIMALEKNLEKFSNRRLLPVVELDSTTTSKESQDSKETPSASEIKVEEKRNDGKVDTTACEEVFMRKISEIDIQSNQTTGIVPGKRKEIEKTKLPRRIFKPTSKDTSGSVLCKIPEDTPVHGNRNQVY